jgi:DNA-binding PadR family transcriptional regulator
MIPMNGLGGTQPGQPREAGALGTLYEALSRLEGQGFIEALESQDRRRPYRLTAAGAAALRAHLDDQRRVADVGLRRLARSWGT